MKTRYFILLLFLATSLACTQPMPKKLVSNQEFDTSFKIETETIVPDLEIPWSFVFLPDNSMLITELNGTLIHFKNNEKIEIENVPEVVFKGQGGLLDIELDPNYKNNGWIYLSYSSKGNDGNGANTTISRGKLNGKEFSDLEVLYKATPNSTGGNHFGSRIEFDNNGYLYFSIGDRFRRDENPQDISKDGGKIYRINSDGSIPEDNPFFNKNNAKQAIYSYGHRNPQGMALHPETGELWTHEHGPQGGDEINIIKPSLNYGWPLASFGINYNGTSFTDATSLPNMEDPLHYWVPSIAPSGMDFITSDIYEGWKGDLLIGSLKFQYLHRCVLDGNKVVSEEKLLEDIGRVRCVRIGPDGYAYIAVQNKGILKLVPVY